MNEDERRVLIGELRIEFDALHGQQYETNDDQARKRGLDFERLIRKVFKAWGMLFRGSFHTGDNKSEQIDGVLQIEDRYALLEVKWEKENLAASALFSFLGKVEGKFVGTIGLFVSRKELTPNFLTALRAGRRQCIVVIHGRDVEHLFDPMFDLAEYLKKHLLHIAMSNTCHLSADKFLEKLKKEAAKAGPVAPAPGAADPIDEFIIECVTDEDAKNVVHEHAAALSNTQCIVAVQRIVNNFADILYTGEKKEQWQSENLRRFLEQLVALLPAHSTGADTAFFITKLSRNFRNPYYGRMAEYFAPRYAHLSDEQKEQFEERLRRQWNEVIGDWMSENAMSVPTRFLWDLLSNATKEHLIGYFVGFVQSDRRTTFEQHQLATFVLAKEESTPITRKVFRSRVRSAARSWMDDDDIDEEGLARAKKAMARTFSILKRYVPEYEKQIAIAVKKAHEDYLAYHTSLG